MPVKKINDGSRGGTLKGKPHYDKSGKPAGGIKAVVGESKKPLELEGGEVIINKAASKKHWRELNKINQSAGSGIEIIDPEKAQASAALGTGGNTESGYTKSRNTAFAIIKKIIDEKGKNFTAYTEEDKELFRHFEGIGGKEKEGTGILDQFFTPDYICKEMYSLARQYGFTDNGIVMEPASGSGRFIKHAPDQNKVVAFEIDKYNYIMSKVLYPDAIIFDQYFETAFLQPPRYTSKYNGRTSVAGYPFISSKESWLGSFDLVIGNPPYGSHKTLYSSYFPKAPKQLEIFFIMYGLKLLKKGGLLVYITSSNFMRNGSSLEKAKQDIFEIATFVDAYRMPNSLFVNTDVGTDIIILKKL